MGSSPRSYTRHELVPRIGVAKKAEAGIRNKKIFRDRMDYEAKFIFGVKVERIFHRRPLLPVQDDDIEKSVPISTYEPSYTTPTAMASGHPHPAARGAEGAEHGHELRGVPSEGGRHDGDWTV